MVDKLTEEGLCSVNLFFETESITFGMYKNDW